LLLEALDGRYTLLVSTTLWLEYEAVLTRPPQLKAMRLTAREVRDALAALATIAEQALVHYLWRPVLTDPADEHVLERERSASGRLVDTAGGSGRRS